MHLLYSRAEQMSIEKYLIVKSVQIYLYAGVCFYLLKIIIFFFAEMWILVLSALFERMTVIFFSFLIWRKQTNFQQSFHERDYSPHSRESFKIHAVDQKTK